MGPHQGRADGEENLPRPAAHTPPNASQDPISFLGRQSTQLLLIGVVWDTSNVGEKQGKNPPSAPETGPWPRSRRKASAGCLEPDAHAEPRAAAAHTPAVHEISRPFPGRGDVPWLSSYDICGSPCWDEPLEAWHRGRGKTSARQVSWVRVKVQRVRNKINSA